MKEETIEIMTYRGYDSVGEVVSEITIPKDKLKSYYTKDEFGGYTDLMIEIRRWEIGGSEKIHKLKL